MALSPSTVQGQGARAPPPTHLLEEQDPSYDITKGLSYMHANLVYE